MSSECVSICVQQSGPPGPETTSNLYLNVSIIVSYASSPMQKIINANVISNALISGIIVSGLQIEHFSKPTPIYCGDGVKQTETSKIQVSSNLYYTEKCDDGNYNSEYRRCNPFCECNSPGFELDSDNVSCVCQQNPSLSLLSTDSNPVQGALNDIQIKFNSMNNMNLIIENCHHTDLVILLLQYQS